MEAEDKLQDGPGRTSFERRSTFPAWNVALDRCETRHARRPMSLLIRAMTGLHDDQDPPWHVGSATCTTAHVALDPCHDRPARRSRSLMARGKCDMHDCPCRS